MSIDRAGLATRLASIAGANRGETSEEISQRVADVCADTFDMVARVFLVDREKDGLQMRATASDAPPWPDESALASTGDQVDTPVEECHRTVKSILVSSVEAAHARWPEWAGGLAGSGVSSAAAHLLGDASASLGVIEILSAREDATTRENVEIGAAVARLATTTLRDSRAIDLGERRALELQEALDSRTVIEQAKGVLAVHLRMHPEDAFNELRNFARSERMKLATAAYGVIDGSIDLRSNSSR